MVNGFYGININALGLKGNQQLGVNGAKAKNTGKFEAELAEKGHLSADGIKNGLSNAELKAMDKNGDGLLTEDEFNNSLKGKMRNEDVQMLWSGYLQSYQLNLSAQNKTVGNETFVTTGTTVTTDTATGSATTTYETKMTGYTETDTDNDGTTSLSRRKFTVGEDGNAVQTNMTVKVENGYSHGKELKNEALGSSTVVDNYNQYEVREIHSGNIDIRGIQYNKNTITSITINGTTYSGNNISKDGDVVTIKDNDGKIIAQAELSPKDNISSNKLRKLRTDFSPMGEAGKEINIDSKGNITEITQNNNITKLKDTTINSKLNTAAGKMGDIINMYAKAGGGTNIPNSVMEELTNLISSIPGKLDFASDAVDSDDGFSMLNGNKWVDENFQDQPEGVRNSMKAALKQMASLSPDGKFSMSILGSLKFSYAALSSKTANINTTNMNTIASNILKGGETSNIVNDIFNGLGDANIGITKDDMYNILMKGDTNKDGRIDDNLEANALNDLVSFTNKLADKREITPDEAHKLADKSMTKSNLYNMIKAFSDVKGVTISNSILDKAMVKIYKEISKNDSTGQINVKDLDFSSITTNVKIQQALTSAFTNIAADGTLDAGDFDEANTIYTILANDVDGNKATNTNLKALRDHYNDVDEIAKISSFDKSSINNIFIRTNQFATNLLDNTLPANIKLYSSYPNLQKLTALNSGLEKFLLDYPQAAKMINEHPERAPQIMSSISGQEAEIKLENGTRIKYNPTSNTEYTFNKNGFKTSTRNPAYVYFINHNNVGIRGRNA